MPSTKPVLKIRPTYEQKAAIEAAARDAGMFASEFALQCTLGKATQWNARTDLLVLNAIERTVTAIEQIAVDQGDGASPLLVASNLQEADRLIANIGRVWAMFKGSRR